MVATTVDVRGMSLNISTSPKTSPLRNTLATIDETFIAARDDLLACLDPGQHDKGPVNSIAQAHTLLHGDTFLSHKDHMTTGDRDYGILWHCHHRRR